LEQEDKKNINNNLYRMNTIKKEIRLHTKRARENENKQLKSSKFQNVPFSVLVLDSMLKDFALSLNEYKLILNVKSPKKRDVDQMRCYRKTETSHDGAFMIPSRLASPHSSFP